ncbi:non-canonical purine NTP pyrophosphatase [Helicobacter baculiformis]|uniref:Non-canonical purine NTP pyrophosphatase n=1 Tax=Helicobacter baculiformis TaxID=427351 RepID=A0ABV7ZI81_9HELI|nr:non-canonical purine NTP pyrophosphatase [Helicobacter baculiformis]
MQIIFSSNNAKKLQEVQSILSGFNVKSYRAFLDTIDIVENGVTFEENAHLKAHSIYKLLEGIEGDYCVLADDSGICVDALNAMPGIYSARFASIQEGAQEILQGCFAIPQKECSDTLNNLKLLACLEELGITQSSASFVCVIAMHARVKGVLQQRTFRGECEGKVFKAPLNPQAFGYDPLFIPKGYTLSMDHIQEKNSISHRFLALQQCKDFLESLGTANIP